MGFNPVQHVVGHEQARERPSLIISTDAFNAGPQQLVMVAPLTHTRTRRPLPFHVWFAPDETGLHGPGTQPMLPDPGVIRCDKIQTVPLFRFTGTGPAGRLRNLLDLPYTP